MLRDIDTYLTGINLWYGQNRPDARAVRPRGHLRVQRDQGAVPRRGRRGRGGERARSSTPRATGSASGAARAHTRTCASETIPRRDDDEQAGAAPDERSARRPRGLVRLEQGSFESAAPTLPGAAASAAAAPVRGQGIQRAARRRRPLGDRHADHGRRPAGRLQLPRPDAGDGALRPDHPRARRDLRAVPGLHADRPRRAVGVDAHLGQRRHRRHLRRAAVRRLARALRLQGQVPPDGAGRTRARSARAATRSGCASGARSTARSSATRAWRAPSASWRWPRKRSSAGRETTDQIFYRRLDVRPACAAARSSSARRARRRRRSTVLRRRAGHRVRDERAAAGPAQRRQRRPAGRRPRPVRVARVPAGRAAPAGPQPGERAARQLEQQAGEELPGRRRPLGRGRHAARRLAAGGARADREAHARDRARRRQRGRHRRPARPHVEVRHRRARARPGAEPARPGRRRPDHRVERRRRELGRRERRRLDRRARAGGDGGDLGRPRRAPPCAAASARSCARSSRRARAASSARPAACTAAGTST